MKWRIIAMAVTLVVVGVAKADFIDNFYITEHFGPTYPYPIGYEFAVSSYMIKASQSQVDIALLTASYPGYPMKVIAANGEEYVDDGSGITYWGFEDGGDRDYKDVMARETVLDGQSKLEFTGSSGYAWCIRDKATGDVLFHYNEFYHPFGDPFETWEWSAIYTSIPEPSTMVLVVFGSILGINRKWKHAKAAAR